ncbi:GH11688 [Drosophila grimshawi]|uniref:GH11688 n=1 Tax=Drosophila grimshawi TaxID=7222 RepID=B4K249_DROGR|nr:GH11688 [Drosophila grimshawi]
MNGVEGAMGRATVKAAARAGVRSAQPFGGGNNHEDDDEHENDEDEDEDEYENENEDGVWSAGYVRSVVIVARDSLYEIQ